MKKSEFYFDLPKELIAQDPIPDRDKSKLLHLDRYSGEIEHKNFYDVIDYLKPGDCLILNNTKVIPARLYGIKPTGAKVEFLMLNNLGDDKWECITGPGRKARTGDTFTFCDGILNCEVIEVLENGNRIAKFSYEASNIYEVLDRIGEMPLPHYITHELKDRERYQTVYAKELGSAAAPTAGLHFTPELLKKIEEKAGVCVYNLGTGNGYSVLDMVKAFSKACGHDLPYKILDRRPGDVAMCYADPAKSAAGLGWRAEKTLADMCRDAWNWQKKNPRGYEE